MAPNKKKGKAQLKDDNNPDYNTPAGNIGATAVPEETPGTTLKQTKLFVDSDTKTLKVFSPVRTLNKDLQDATPKKRTKTGSSTGQHPSAKKNLLEGLLAPATSIPATPKKTATPKRTSLLSGLSSPATSKRIKKEGEEETIEEFEESKETVSVNLDTRDMIKFIPVGKVQRNAGASGFVVHFVQAPNKSGKEKGPFSNYFCAKLCREGYQLGHGIAFQLRQWDFLSDGKITQFQDRYGRVVKDQCSVLIGINLHDTSKEAWLQLAQIVTEEIHSRYMASKWANEKGVCKLEEEDDAWLEKVEEDNRWSDFLGNEAAYNMLMFRYPSARKDARGFPAEYIEDDEASWAKTNIQIIRTFFREGLLEDKYARTLGLPKTWTTTTESDASADDDDAGDEDE